MMGRFVPFLSWSLVILAWFWVDGSLPDPAGWKNALLPVTLGVVLACQGRLPPLSRMFLVGLVFWGWSFLRLGPTDSIPSDAHVLAGGVVAFLIGVTGGVPPTILALVALALAVGKGWDDLLFLHNIGQGIPFTPTSFFVHRNLFAVLLAPSLFLLGGWISTTTSRLHRWCGSILLVAGAGLVMVCESRGATLGIVAALVVLASREVVRKWDRRSFRWIGLLVGVSAVLLIVSQVGRGRQTLEEARALVSGEPISKSVQARFRPWVWTGAMRLLEPDPILGIGVGEFPFAIESVLDPWQDQYRHRPVKVGVAHSHWIQTLVERGIVGFLLEGVLLVGAAWFALRRGRRGLAGALICIGVHGFVSEGLEFLSGSTFWWYLIGLGISPGKGAPSRPGYLLASGVLLALGVGAATEQERIRSISWIERGISEGTFTWDSVERALEAAPTSPTLLLWIARSQAAEGNLAGARKTLEHLRTMYPSDASVDLELPLIGVWRETGNLDSAHLLVGRMVALFPFDPWLLGEAMRVRLKLGGCEAVEAFRDSLEPRVGPTLARIDSSGMQWKTWRAGLVFDQDLAKTTLADLRARDMVGKARILEEWKRALTVCRDAR